jgi:hypothetical protein
MIEYRRDRDRADGKLLSFFSFRIYYIHTYGYSTRFVVECVVLCVCLCVHMLPSRARGGGGGKVAVFR